MLNYIRYDGNAYMIQYFEYARTRPTTIPAPRVPTREFLPRVEGIQESEELMCTR